MSGITVGTALAIGSVATAGAGIAGAAISSHAAGKAADKQVNAANYSADLQKQAADESLAFQKEQFKTQQEELQPWLQSGQQGLANLDYLLGLNPSKVPGTGGSTTNLSGLVNPQLGAAGSLTAPWTEQFKAPTAEEARQTPGYQFILDQGRQALENSAAAKGNLLSGDTMAGITKFGEGVADTTYDQTYNRAFNEYGTRYNTFKQNQADLYNKLAAMSGTGQVTADRLGTAGQTTANNVTNLLTGTAANIGNTIQRGQNTASGYETGAANAWANTLSGMGGDVMNAFLMSKLLGQDSSIYGHSGSSRG